MERIKVAQNFYLDEFVDPRTYLTEPDNGLSKMNPIIFQLAQLLRSLFGKSININNWWGLYLQLKKEGKSTDQIIRLIENSKRVSKWSGYRPPECKIGAKKSEHRFGNAIDPKGDQNKLAEIVKANAALFYAFGLRRLENPDITPGWLHMDTSESKHIENEIRVINRTSHAYNIKT